VRSRRRQVPFQAQLDASDCGAAALSMVLRYHGIPRGLNEVRMQMRAVRGGVTASSLVYAARHFGLVAKGARAPVSALPRLGAGTILFWRGNHYVVLERIGRKGAIIADPSVGRRQVTLDELAESYSGVAIRFDNDATGSAGPASARTEDVPVPSSWRGIGLFIPRDWRWAAVLGCSVVLILATALTPLLVDRLTHTQAAFADVGWRFLAAMGAAVLLIYACAQVIRNTVVVQLQGVSDHGSTMAILRRILGARMSCTARRSGGDLIMRVRTSYVVRAAVSGLAVAAVFDGLLILVYLALLVSIDRSLASVVLGLVGLQLVILMLVWRTQKLLNATAVNEEAHAQSALFELLRGIATIKSLGLEATAAARFDRSLRKEVAAQVAARRNLGSASAVTSLIQFAAPLVVLTVGSIRVAHDQATLGVVLAFGVVALGVFAPLASMVQAVLQLATLEAHFARVADIMETDQERAAIDTPPRALSGAVSFRDVSFRYLSDTPVLRNVSFEVRRGQAVIVSGDSGAGKSTLAMLVAGVLDADSGQVCLDGQDVAGLDKQWIRRQVGYVAQSCDFFTGTLRENIDLGHDYSDEEVRRASRIAGLDAVIESLPMGYQTAFVPSNFPLSGGQLQRLALARALVRNPPILVLDEATNALDLAAEREVIERISELGRTVIIISHRPYSQLTGDVRLLVGDGRVRQEAIEDGVPGGSGR
jgi:ATP-binding cassette, subfamily B, bacterial